MFSYQQLDALADAYNPALAVMALFFVARAMKHDGRRGAMQLVFAACAGLGVYGLMWIDSIFLLWPSMGLDYSTHSAVALALVTTLVLIERRLVVPLVISLLIYAVLMIYQRYHTWADILSTLLVVGTLLFILVYLQKHLQKFSRAAVRLRGEDGKD